LAQVGGKFTHQRHRLRVLHGEDAAVFGRHLQAGGAQIGNTQDCTVCIAVLDHDVAVHRGDLVVKIRGVGQGDGGGVSLGDTADIGGDGTARQALQAHIIGIALVHMEDDGLSGTEVDLVLGTVGLECTDGVGGDSGTGGIALASLTLLDPVDKYSAGLAAQGIGQTRIEVAVVQQNVTDLGEDGVGLQAVGLLHHVIQVIGGPAQGIVDAHAVDIVLVPLFGGGSGGGGGDQLQLVGAVGQHGEGYGGNVVVVAGHGQVIDGDALDHGGRAGVILLGQHCHHHAGAGIGTGVHIHTGSREGKLCGGTHFLVQTRYMGAAVGEGQVIFQRIGPAVDVTVGAGFDMLRNLGVLPGIGISDLLPGTGEGEALDAVLGGILGSNKGVLIIDVVGRDHRDLVPQIAVFVGILGEDGLSPGVAEHIELVEIAPVHRGGLVADLLIFDLYIAEQGIAIGIFLAICGIGGGGIEPVHAVFDIAVHMDGGGILAVLIVKIPAGEVKFLAVVQHVCPFHENGGGLVEGQQQLPLTELVGRQPQTGTVLVGLGGAAPLDFIGGLYPGDGHDHLVARGLGLVDVPLGEVIAGNVHRMRMIGDLTIGIGGVFRVQVVNQDGNAVFFVGFYGLTAGKLQHSQVILKHRLTRFVHFPEDLIGLQIQSTLLQAYGDHRSVGEDQALVHDIPQNGVRIQDDLRGDLGGDIPQDVFKVFLQVGGTFRGGIVAGVGGFRIAAGTLIDGGAAHLTGVINRGIGGGGDLVIGRAYLIVPAVPVGPAAADPHIAVLQLVVIVIAAYIEGAVIFQGSAALGYGVGGGGLDVIHGLGTGVVGGQGVHIVGRFAGGVHTGALIQTDGVHIGTVGVLGDIGLGNGVVGLGDGLLIVLVAAAVIKAHVAGFTVGEHQHQPDTAFAGIYGGGLEDLVCHLHAVAGTGGTVSTQRLGGRQKPGVGAAGTGRTHGNGDQSILIDALLEAVTGGLLPGIDTLVTVKGGIGRANAVGVDLSGLGAVAVGPYVRMVGEEPVVGVELLVAVQPQTAAVSGQLHEAAHVLLVVHIAEYGLPLQQRHTGLLLVDQVAVLVMVGQKQVHILPVYGDLGVVDAVGGHGGGIGQLRIVKAVDIVQVELTVGVEDTGVDPAVGFLAAGGLHRVGAVSIGFVTGIAHDGDPVVHLVMAAVVSQGYHKAVHRTLQSVQVFKIVLCQRTGLVQNHHDIQRRILLDQGGDGVILGVDIHGDGIGAVILQHRGFIDLQIALHLLGVAVGAVRQVVDDHEVFGGIVADGHGGVVGPVHILTGGPGTGIHIAVQGQSLVCRHHHISQRRTGDGLGTVEDLIGVQLQVADGIVCAGELLPLSGQGDGLGQGVAHVDGAVVDIDLVGLGGGPAREHIALPIGVGGERIGIAPGVHMHIALIAGAVIHMEILQTVNGGGRIVAQVQIQDHGILLGDQGHLQGDTLLADLIQVVIGGAVMDGEGAVVGVFAAFFHISAFHIVAVELVDLSLVFIKGAVGVPVPHILGGGDLVAQGRTVAGGGVDGHGNTEGIYGVLGDHLIVVDIAQIPVEDLYQCAGGPQIVLDLRGIHPNGLGIAVRGDGQVDIHLTGGRHFVNQNQGFFGGKGVVLIVIVGAGIVQAQYLDAVLGAIVGKTQELVGTGTLGYIGFGYGVDDGNLLRVNGLEGVAYLLLQDHHHFHGPVCMGDERQLAVLQVAGIHMDHAEQVEVFVVAGVIGHVFRQKLTGEVFHGVALCIGPADKQLVICVGDSGVAVQIRIPILVFQNNGFLSVDQTCTGIKGDGIGVYGNGDHGHTVLLVGGGVIVSTVVGGMGIFRIGGLLAGAALHIGTDGHCGGVKAGVVGTVGVQVAGGVDDGAVRKDKGGDLHPVDIGNALTFGPVLPYGVGAGALAVYKGDGDGNAGSAFLLRDGVPAQNAVLFTPVEELHVHGLGLQAFVPGIYCYLEVQVEAAGVIGHDNVDDLVGIMLTGVGDLHIVMGFGGGGMVVAQGKVCKGVGVGGGFGQLVVTVAGAGFVKAQLLHRQVRLVDILQKGHGDRMLVALRVGAAGGGGVMQGDVDGDGNGLLPQGGEDHSPIQGGGDEASRGVDIAQVILPAQKAVACQGGDSLGGDHGLTGMVMGFRGGFSGEAAACGIKAHTVVDTFGAAVLVINDGLVTVDLLIGPVANLGVDHIGAVFRDLGAVCTVGFAVQGNVSAVAPFQLGEELLVLTADHVHICGNAVQIGDHGHGMLGLLIPLGIKGNVTGDGDDLIGLVLRAGAVCGSVPALEQVGILACIYPQVLAGSADGMFFTGGEHGGVFRQRTGVGAVSVVDHIVAHHMLGQLIQIHSGGGIASAPAGIAVAQIVGVPPGGVMDPVGAVSDVREGQGVVGIAAGKVSVAEIHRIIAMGDGTGVFRTELELTVCLVGKPGGDIANALFIGLHLQGLIVEVPVPNTGVMEPQGIAAACRAGIDDQIGGTGVDAVRIQLIPLGDLCCPCKLHGRKQGNDHAQKKRKGHDSFEWLHNKSPLLEKRG